MLCARDSLPFSIESFWGLGVKYLLISKLFLDKIFNSNLSKFISPDFATSIIMESISYAFIGKNFLAVSFEED